MSAPAPTETPTGPVDAAAGAPESGTPDDGAGDRGRLDIAFGVVRKIAEHAADTAEGTTTVHRSLAGVGLGESGSTVKVSGYGEQVDLRLEVPLVYPAPISSTVEAVRETVRERVQTLTGYRVRSLDVTVSALTDPAAARTPTTSRTE